MCISQIDIAGVVVRFESELSVMDLLVAEFSPKPIATAVSPAVTHITARRIEVPRASSESENRTLEGGIGGEV